MIQDFHFIRAEWLLAMIPLLLLGIYLLRKPFSSRSWQAVIDPQLLDHMLIGNLVRGSRRPIGLLLIAGLLAILALAGPAWKKLPQPVFKDQSALVIALDLSRSMDAADIKPSRLTRARHKITDILRQRHEGQTALLVYAADPFIVSPLTDDTNTINLLVPSLETAIMPSQGSRVDKLLDKATELFSNAGIAKGDIILVTDGIDKTAIKQVKTIHQQGHRISILGLGSTEGAPIPLANGGFLKSADGSIVVPRLDRQQLAAAAAQGGGRFAMLSSDDRDILHLLGLLEINRLQADNRTTDRQADVWREEGPWLLLLLLPLSALAFRRGYLVLLVCCITPWPQPADAIGWDELWHSADQRASEQLQQGNNQQAAELFNDPQWKAAASYRAGQYEQTVQQLEAIDQADAHYNRGNALAKLGRLPQAIEAYNQALQLQADHQDTLFNKQLVEQQLDQQEQEQQQKDQQGDKQSSENEASKDKGNKQSDNQDSTQNQNQQAQSQQKPSPDKQQEQQSSQQDQQNADAQADNNPQPNHQQSHQPTDNANKANDEQQTAQQQNQMDQQEQQLSQQAKQQWLRRVPDDPGGLLRNKFNYQYKRQKHRSNEQQAW